jgi:hypothetical protein
MTSEEYALRFQARTDGLECDGERRNDGEVGRGDAPKSTSEGDDWPFRGLIGQVPHDLHRTL